MSLSRFFEKFVPVEAPRTPAIEPGFGDEYASLPPSFDELGDASQSGALAMGPADTDFDYVDSGREAELDATAPDSLANTASDNTNLGTSEFSAFGPSDYDSGLADSIAAEHAAMTGSSAGGIASAETVADADTQAASMGPDATQAPYSHVDPERILDGRRHRLNAKSRNQKLHLAMRVVLPSILFVCAFGAAIWFWGSGRFDVMTYKLAATLETSGSVVGFQVQDVVITGRAHTSQDAIIAALGIVEGDSLLSIKPAEVRARLETLPWIESVRVERILPKGLRLTLSEREPVAIWQNQGTHRLVDRSGVEIIGAPVEPFAEHLPIITGTAALDNIGSLFSLLRREPELFSQTIAATRVSGQRWDVLLQGQVLVKLPAQDPSRAWSTLAMAQRRGRLLDREISSIDLRIPDRMIVVEADNLALGNAGQPRIEAAASLPASDTPLTEI